MNRKVQKWMIALSLFAACMLVAVPAIAQGRPPAPAPPTQNVVVVNGTRQPVPTAAQGTTAVAGTVNVGNTPNVNVTNTPTVSLASGASVNVVNPLDGQNNPTPLAVLEATQSYEDQCGIDFAGNSYGSCSFTAIPQGKQLIVQEFDAFGQVEAGNRPTSILLGTTPWVITSPTHSWLASAGSTILSRTRKRACMRPQARRRYVRCSYLSFLHQGYICNFSGFLVDVSQADQGTTIRHQPQPPRLPFRPAPSR